MAQTLFKPPGVTVFPLHADPGADCLLWRLLEREPGRRALAWPEGFEGGIAHRLDRWTSGAVLVADDPDELAALREAFATAALTKTYRFLSARRVPWTTNRCERALAHARRDRRRMVVQRGASTPHRGRWYPASTQFRHLGGELWEAVITTGVMHQIRAHAAFVGLPLTGDGLYGGGRDPGGFKLHHVGLVGPGIATDPVPMPSWAASSARS